MASTLLKTEFSFYYLHIPFLHPRRHFVSITKFIRKKILTVYFDHRKKHTNIECGKSHSSLLMLKKVIQIAPSVIQRGKCLEATVELP